MPEEEPFTGRALLSRLGPMDRVLANSRVLDSGCREWLGSKDKDGYGYFQVDGRRCKLHRWMWEQVNGQFPEGLLPDHFKYPQDGCIGPSCIEPEHIRPVSPWENTLRGDGPSVANVAKTHCPEGHPYDEANTFLSKSGRRICRKCRSRATMNSRKRRRHV